MTGLGRAGGTTVYTGVVPVDPFLVPLLADAPALTDDVTDWDAQRRWGAAVADALVRRYTEPGPDVAECRDLAVPLGDNEFLDVRVYRPEADKALPAHLYLHGGGWVGGSVRDAYVDIVCRERCVGARCVVVSVGYRKAPEHRFPTAIDDALAALRWTVSHAEELGVLPDVVTVGGTSSGANLAAALALRVRDEGGPCLAFQLLEVPPLDLTFGLPSHDAFGRGYGLELEELRRLAAHYLVTAEQATDPYASPLHAPDLAGLPPTHLIAAEYDLLRDDALRYAERLTGSGVPATYSVQRGHVHFSAACTAVMPSARAWRDEAVDVLRRAHENGIAGTGR